MLAWAHCHAVGPKLYNGVQHLKPIAFVMSSGETSQRIKFGVAF